VTKKVVGVFVCVFRAPRFNGATQNRNGVAVVARKNYQIVQSKISKM
jgi:hypothetical protein